MRCRPSIHGLTAVLLAHPVRAWHFRWDGVGHSVRGLLVFSALRLFGFKLSVLPFGVSGLLGTGLPAFSGTGNLVGMLWSSRGPGRMPSRVRHCSIWATVSVHLGLGAAAIVVGIRHPPHMLSQQPVLGRDAMRRAVWPSWGRCAWFRAYGLFDSAGAHSALWLFWHHRHGGDFG